MGFREEHGDEAYDKVIWFLQSINKNIVTCPHCGKAQEAGFIDYREREGRVPDHICWYCTAVYKMDEFPDLFY